MSRRLRFDIAGNPQHVIQRGNNRAACFFAEADYVAYLHWLREGSQCYGVAVHAYCLMTNHVHLLVAPETPGAVSRLMQHVGRHYVNYTNKVYRRSGTLWEGRYKSCLVDSEAYLLKLHQYIEYNPLRAGMVARAEDYRWSSYRHHGCAEDIAGLTDHPCYERLGASPQERAESYRGLCDTILDLAELAEIRLAANQGLVLGSERFKDQLEAAMRRRVRPGISGRPRKETNVTTQGEQYGLDV